MTPSVTGAMTKEDFTHVLREVLNQASDSIITRTFEEGGITDAVAILMLSAQDLREMTYSDPPNSSIFKKLLPGNRGLIMCFQAYVRHKAQNGQPIEGEWQNILDRDDFKMFRVTFNPDVIAPPQTPPTPGGTTASPRVRDTVFEFKKGIKRDPMSFTVLKDNKQWDSAH
jgi:hypothetical protein